MSTALPVAYAHQVDYFTKGIDQGGPYYRVEYQIGNWSDADAFVNALLGHASVSGGAGGTIIRTSPHQHPLSPNLFCASAEVVSGLGAPILNASGFPSYSGGALIRAEYRAPSIDLAANPLASFDQTGATPIVWATQELDFGCEVYTVSGSTYAYSSGPNSGKSANVPVKITVPLTTMVLTYHRLPYIPMTAVRNLRFRVNSATFLGATAGTVLFKGARTSRDFNTDGTVIQKVQLVFDERDAAYPWNSLPARDTLDWYPVADGSGNKIYRTADLSPLVQF